MAQREELAFETSTDPLEQIALEQERIDNPELFSDAITPSQFEPELPLTTIQVPPEDTIELTDTINGSAASVRALTDYSAEQLKAEQESATTQQDILDVISQASGLEADIQAAGEESGLAESTKRLAELDAQAQSLLRESKAIPIQLQEKIAGTGTTVGGLAPLQASALRRNALKALSIAQQTDIATANYTAAKDKAQQIIDLKYKPLEQKLDLLNQQYLFNKDNLERIDKKQADALAENIKRQETELQDRKDLEADINAVALEATKNNAPASVIRAISGAKTIGEALAQASGFMADELAESLKQAQIDKIKADITRTDEKFEQDKIEFGEEIALKNRVQALAELKESGKLVEDSNIGKTIKIGDEQFMWNTETQNYDIKLGGTGNLSEADASNISEWSLKSSKIGELLDLKDTGKIEEITGTGSLASLKFSKNAIAGKTQTTLAKLSNLLQAGVLETLIDLKSKGGTLGALSNEERKMLLDASSVLASAMETDKNGNILGFQIDKDSFITALQELQSGLDIKLVRLQGSSDDLFDELFDIKDDDNLFDFTDSMGESPDFPNGGSGSPTATTDTKKVAQAIGQFESGGNYKARGPVVTSGQYKGEKAAGKYQIMPGNIPSWSREALGKSISLQTFLDRPDLQDKIAEYKMSKILAQYGNVEDVASVWFSGRPVAQAGQAKDVLGTTTPEYISNITSIFNRLA